MKVRPIQKWKERILTRKGHRKDLWEPFEKELHNRVDYWIYCMERMPLAHKRESAVLLIGNVLSVFSLITFLLRILCLFYPNFADWLSTCFGVVLSKELPGGFEIFTLVATVLFPISFGIMNHYININRRYLSLEDAASDIYKNVMPPKQRKGIAYRRLDVVRGGSTESVFVSSEIDRWLISNAPITMKRSKDYERNLKKNISRDFKELYQPFLRLNHLDALFHGRQFTNEKKWGISQELFPKIPDPNSAASAPPYEVLVHQSCYYDTYLTNIIPGKQLVSNQTNQTVAKADGYYLPYITVSDQKVLKDLGAQYTANELGVTTLCILKGPDVIPLWTQNRLAQSSRKQFVASGSGSADWNDCQTVLKGSKDFREAVIYGMERELYEESANHQKISRQTFFHATETYITGYFRWLQKGAKSEFVGLSRVDLPNILDLLTPQQSEVIVGKYIAADTMAHLKHDLQELVHSDPRDSGRLISAGCNVSCAMAIWSLENRCEVVCEKCRKAGTANCDSCSKIPYDALFEDDVQLR